jgi:predicted MPP superfamily phosphohydrolase
MLYDLWCWASRPRPSSDTSDRADVPDLARRRLIKSGIGLAAAAPFLISGHGVIRGRRRFQIDHFDLPVGSVSSPLANFSIVHLTDIHVGPYLTGEELSEYVEAANRLKPDLVALTGDFVSTGFGDVEPCAVALAQLRARYGVFACLGNHEVLAGVEDVLAERLRAAGIEVLRNDARSLRLGHTVLNVLGIDDLKWGVPRLGRALAAAREPGEFNLLLSHRPEVFPQAADRTIHLVLSGHYHGGQVKLSPHPEGLSIARLITPYAEGLFELRAGASREKALLFVGRGVGITGLPIRVNCPPQIAHLTLARTEKA